VALEVLDEYFSKKRNGILAKLNTVKNAEEAFMATMLYQALNGLIGELKASVTFGESASSELMEEE
jgi:hypothetical protein